MTLDRLIEFNLVTKEKKILDIGTLISNDRNIDEIKRLFGISGLNIEVTNIDDSELLLKKYYEYQNYSVIKCSSTFYASSVPDKICSFLKIEKNVTMKTGVPDFCIYKESIDGIIIDAFFVEVKTISDGVKISQLEWIFSNPEIPIKIIYLEDTSKRRFV
jgi:hypothetical protein